MVVIVDYGMGNLASIGNMLKKAGVQALISADIASIERAEKLILPGVGAFEHGMANMHKLGLFPLLNDRVINRKIPILGICLGMQLMTKKSEEGALPGFGWVDAATVRFKFGQGQNDLKIPHMGWNTVKIRKEAEFFKAIIQEPRFYFVHSYHVVCANETDIWTTTFHGYEFVSAFLRDNIAGVQFHPEKSHKMGLAFLRAWAMS